MHVPSIPAKVLLDFFLLIDTRFFASRGTRHKPYINSGIIGARIFPRAVDIMLVSLPVEAEKVTPGLQLLNLGRILGWVELCHIYLRARVQLLFNFV